MTRSYGLFAANPLGQGAFEGGRKISNPKWLNLTLHDGEKVKFRYRIIIYDGKMQDKDLESIYKRYCGL